MTFTDQTSGSWASNRAPKLAEWPAVNAGYVRITVTAASGNYVNLCDSRIGGRTSVPALLSATAPYPSSAYFKLINFGNNQLAINSGGSVPTGTAVSQWTWDRSPNLQWQIVDLKNGYYQIKSRANGLVLDSRNGAAGSGVTETTSTWDPDAGTGSTDQQWSIVRLGHGFFYILNRTNGLALDNGGQSANGSPLKQWNWNGSTNLMWRIEAVPQ